MKDNSIEKPQFSDVTLKERLSRLPRGLDADEALRIVRGLLDGIIDATENDLVYSGIRPANILIGKDGEVRLADCRDAGAHDVAVDAETVNSRNYDYMAPECEGGRFPGDVRSGVFSVGVVLHEMLTGKTPYNDKDGQGEIRISPHVGRLLVNGSEILSKALAVRREDRHANFQSLREALKVVKCWEIAHGDKTYRLLQYVGRGAYSDMFKALWVQTGQVVAVKRAIQPRYAESLHREAYTLKRLDDSSAVRVIEVFDLEFPWVRETFLALTFLPGMPGSSLHDAIQRHRSAPIEAQDVFRAFAMYASELAKMHRLGVVHRDIRPFNLYYPEWDLGKAAILDFGCVLDVNGTVTETGAVPCTLDYMPPEVVLGSSRGDAGMDIYALGLSLYEALTGKCAYYRLPRGAQSFGLLFDRARCGAQPSFDDEQVTSNPALLSLLRDMTNPDPKQRIQSAEIVERRLRELIDADEGLSSAVQRQEIEMDSELFDDETDACDDCITIDSHVLESDQATLRGGGRKDGEMPLRIRLIQRIKEYFGGLVLEKYAVKMISVLIALGCFWLAEACVGECMSGLKNSLPMRTCALLPWLIGLVWAEAKTGRLPNALTLGCMLTGIGVSAAVDGVSLGSSVGAAVAGLMIILPLFMLKSVCGGTVKMFAAVLSFWGIRIVPFAVGSIISLALVVCSLRFPLHRWFKGCSESKFPTSPLVVLSAVSVIASVWFWPGHGLLGGYVFIAIVLLVSFVVWLLTRGDARPPSSVSARGIADAPVDATVGQETHGDAGQTAFKSMPCTMASVPVPNAYKPQFSDETLEERLSHSPCGMDVDEIWFIATGLVDELIAEGLRGVVRKEIGPANIRLCRDGTVRPTSCESMTMGCGEMGCRTFESAKGHVRDLVYSVGAILHEMLIGKAPDLQVLPGKSVRADSRVRGRRRLLPHIGEVIDKALNVQREDRYADLRSFKTDLEALRCWELKRNDGERTYRLLQYVGMGRGGLLFKARLQQTGQLVTIVKQSFLSGSLLRREAEMIKRMKSPYFPQIIDFLERHPDEGARFGEDECFLVSTYLENLQGASLCAAIKAVGNEGLPKKSVLEAFGRYAAGLAAMHSVGVVHGEIRPSELYCPDGAPEKAMIVSLGWCRFCDNAGYDGTNRVPVCLDYMPPEVMVGVEGTFAMDVYALGLCLYEALTGTRPYPALSKGTQGLFELHHRVRDHIQPSFEDERVTTDAALMSLIREMTCWEPAERIRASDVAARIHDFLNVPVQSPELLSEGIR